MKTKKVLLSCIGGVMFIDEAYALGNGHGDGRDIYSKECIDTLNAFLSDHKNDFCCIIAGYKDKLEDCFFAVNPGLQRRFPWVYDIEKYGPEEITAIFKKQVSEAGWELCVTDKFLVEFFKGHMDNFENFGGDTETFFGKSKLVHSKRVFGLDSSHFRKLTEEDLIESFKFYLENRQKKDSDEHTYKRMFI